VKRRAVLGRANKDREEVRLVVGEIRFNAEVLFDIVSRYYQLEGRTETFINSKLEERIPLLE